MLTSRGYRIPLEGSAIHMKKLTIYSEARSDYPGPKPKVICYRRSKNFLYVPRYYGIENIGEPKTNSETNNSVLLEHLNFNGTLRDYQKEIVDRTLENFKNGPKGGIWSIATGGGKTACALYMITAMKIKTIIIVHKQVLLDQWVERIEQFIPNARIGLIQGSVVDIEEKDIVIAMVQSLTRKEYPRETFKTFEMMIVDECHCICSQTFSEALFMIQTRYRIGLSATPRRKDGFDKVFLYHIGPIIIELHNSIVEPEIVFVFTPEMKDIEVVNNNFGKVNIPKLITDIANHSERNKFIINIIKDVMKEDRKMLVFSDRTAQCKKLDELFKKEITQKTSNIFIGEKKKEELQEALHADVIFATYGICKEGFDCPSLDTLLFATPKSDVIQAVGRILRKKNTFHPIVFDIVDKQFGLLKGQYYKRKQYYKLKKYVIRGQEINNQENNEKIKNKCLIRNV